MANRIAYPLTPFRKSAWMDWASGESAGSDLAPLLRDILNRMDAQSKQDADRNASLQYIKKGVHNLAKPNDDNGLYELSPSLETSDSPYKQFE